MQIIKKSYYLIFLEIYHFGRNSHSSQVIHKIEKPKRLVIIIHVDFRCPRLVKPANGKRVYIDGGRKFNKTAKFTCNQGFVLVGSSVRTCRGNEDWDGVQPICGEYVD